jgi:hypothetical protein
MGLFGAMAPLARTAATLSNRIPPNAHCRDMARRSTRNSAAARIWRDYGLSILVATLFIVSIVLHTVFGWWQYAADQTQHGAVPTLWGEDGYAIYWGEWTFQNWQSEFLEVLVLIVLTKYFIHKGSPESRDGQDEMQQAIERIEKQLKEMAK